ncbi:tetratricopeptide repeat protein [Oecophyllibacter saccharovorans]|uniref:tetratricopeptide repeat protein n=1 Tax=Oecophyllibacter saccharovorans TaxID=2558360 RepID=UPI0011415C4A|nr:tetratricopeptide repeat protein [Oecophyllibacter saccharovorans]QDH15301.1 tetratricopeptide repeat protein [Oecophyllibacter saccharovorans]
MSLPPSSTSSLLSGTTAAPGALPAGSLSTGPASLENTGIADGADDIREADEKTFMTDVIEASRTKPVVVDFWASGNAACQQLTPLLEEAVRATAGQVRLVKVDVKTNKALTAQLMQIGLPLQAVPLVVAFWKGNVVDVFQGLKPVSFIRTFIETLLKDAGLAMPATELLKQATAALKAQDGAQAASLYSQVLEAEPENPAAWSGLIRALLALDDVESAEETLGEVPESLADNEDITSARQAIALFKESQGAAGELETLRKEAQARPEDVDTQLKYASALNGSGKRDEAADVLLGLIAKDREGPARAELLRFFDGWGHADPATMTARRKLSTLLFT